MTASLGSDPCGISNDMMSSGVRTFHVCHRCIGAFANGELKVFGETGCTMPDFDGNEELYACWNATTRGWRRNSILQVSSLLVLA
jgi:hypothetical protein